MVDIKLARSAMKAKSKLSKNMTVVEFDNGYWYATEIKDFARAIGIPHSNKLRKDELEKSIKLFLETGKVVLPTKRSLAKSGVKDIEKGLSLYLPIVHYTSNMETKDFIVREAQKIAPGLKRKSGARYRLNRWREEQLTKGEKITYGDLVQQYVQLNQGKEPFEQIPIVCYINFLSDFLSAEQNATRADAMAAWKQVKRLDVPKNYQAWKKASTKARP
jgi:SAP domain-containing new25